MNVKNNSVPQLEQGRNQPDSHAIKTTRTRGYQKLAYAAQALDVDFRGLIVLDIGSSTGGFTSYALEHGAEQVIAIEKGTNQMIIPLRLDPRVELHEKTDIFQVRLQSSSTNLTPNNPKSDQKLIRIPTPDLVLADVSFISLSSVLAYAKQHLATSRTRFLVMLKPQFEARPTELQNGVVKNSKFRRNIIKRFEEQLKKQGFHLIRKIDNQLAGRSGNLERFYYLSIES